MASKKLQIVGGFNIPQADFNQTDEAKSDFIKNKPDLEKFTAVENVTELPTSNISPNKIYNLFIATFIHNRHVVDNSKCYIVDELPTTGENATNLERTTITAYYNLSDKGVYGYLDADLAAGFTQLAGTTIVAGWYTAEQLLPIAGWSYAGVINHIGEDPNDDTIRVLLEKKVYIYFGEWIELTNSIVDEKLPTPDYRGHWAYTVQRRDTEDGGHEDDYELHLISHSINEVYPYQIPLRQNGIIKTATPIEDLDAANKNYVDTAVANLVNGAPEQLNTLNELAEALADDSNFATTVITELGNKVDKVEGKGLSTNDYTTQEKEKLASIEIDQVYDFTSTNAQSGTAVAEAIEQVTQDVTVETTSYRQIIPENIQPLVKVHKIGGKSFKTNNLIPYPYAETTKTVNGITFTDNGDGTVTVNGTATANATFYLSSGVKLDRLTAGETYIPSVGNSVTGNSVILMCNYEDADGVGKNFTTSAIGARTYPSDTTKDTLYLLVQNGTTVNNVTVKPMLNEGDTALPYEPYFEGLRDTKVTALESEGANLLPFPYSETTKTVNGITFTVNDDRSISVKGTATANATFYFVRNLQVSADNYYISGEGDIRGYKVDVNDNRTYFNKGAQIFNQPYYISMYVVVLEGDTVDYTVYPMMNRGTTALPYKPYVGTLDTLAIPEAVQSLEGYGKGVNETYYNYIDFERKVFVRNTARQLVADSEITSQSVNEKAYLLIALQNTPYGDPFGYGVCDKFEIVRKYASEISSVGQAMISPYSNGVYLRTDMTVEDFKTQYADMVIEYALAEPVETDISEYLTDEFIEVEGYGTITAVNEHEEGVLLVTSYAAKSINFSEYNPDERMLENAKDYADAKDAEIVNYIDTKDNENKQYVDTKFTESKQYVDNKVIYEPDLSWGGKALAGRVSPIDLAMSNEFNANRLAFMPPEDITVEYSTDGGTTWIDYGLTDLQKQALVTSSHGVIIGKNTSPVTINDKVRVTIKASLNKTYFSARKAHIYVSTAGASGSNVIVESANVGSETVFQTRGTYPLSGWPGWNSIPCDYTFGGSENQTYNTRVLRFTFGITGLGSSGSNGLTILSMRMFGENLWSCSGGNIPRTGHLYAYDINKNATFPADVKAPTFTGDLTGNATSATKATQDASGNVIADTYATKTELDAKAPKSHTHKYAASDTVNGAAIYAYSPVPIHTTGNGSAYLATVPSITTLVVGRSFVMVPHTVSTIAAPTLNVNGLGAKPLGRRTSSKSTMSSGASSDWLAANQPVTVIYNGSQWVVDEYVRVDVSDATGTLSTTHGGTGSSTVSGARTKLGLDTAYSACNGYNTSKGTIEERLTNLGFKRGTLTSSVGGSVRGEICKQGNIVWWENFAIDNCSITFSEDSEVLIGTIPSEFAPATGDNYGYYGWAITNINEPYYSCVFKINSSGNVYVYLPYSRFTQDTTHTMKYIGCMIGYEGVSL